jgi:alkylation response protein AidB-like acyl-CoA dehydrogenase
MNEYAAPLRDMRFILNHLAGLDEIAALPGCEEATPDLVDAILDEAGKFSAGVLAPLNPVGDEQGCRVENGSVTTPAGWADAYAQFREAGWVGLSMPPQYGGQGLPKLVATPVTEMWFSANLAFSVLPPMALGSAETLMLAASDELKAAYLPKMASGEWAATMDLSEPNAGSDLGAIQTRAEPRPDGSYRLYGQKIFITYGDHELSENIVHLVLARMPGAPAGVRGISMFLVPKFLLNADGSLGARNDMRCISLEHKLGIHGSPTCTMSYGDADGAVGYLVGEPNRGLEYMFVMVNESRFNVGMQGIALGERAYRKALAYSRERLQGRDAITGEQNVPIGRHPDVKRMLLTMRANVMASRMLAYVAAGWFDRAKYGEAGDRYRQLVDLLMPVVKGWSTELGIETADLGIQIHGGMGFVEETGVAQYLRDVRITSIYEGTTGIQANDLISRKLLRDQGGALTALIEEIRGVAAQAAGGVHAAEFAQGLERIIALLEQVCDWIIARGRDAIGEVLAGGVPFLRLLGLACGAWQMTRAALAAHALLAKQEGDAGYLRGIVELARFYFGHLAPQAAAHAHTVMHGGAVVAHYSDEAF